MDLIVALINKPHLIVPFLAMCENLASGLLVWYFDALISFLVAFALVYGLFSLTDALWPPRLGARPRVWRVPVLFAAVAIGFPFFLDAFVTGVFRNLLNHASLISGDILLRTAGYMWLAGVAVSLYRSVWGAVRLSRAAGRLPLCRDATLLAAMRRAAADAGVRRTVALRVGAVGTPILSCGIWRPRIVVPENFAARYSPEERYAILLHECIHIRRHDVLALLCLAVAASVLWFDPVSRHALRRMQTDIELLCDWTAVNAHRVNPVFYARLIVAAIAEEQRFLPAFSEEYRAVAGRLGHILRDDALRIPSRLSRRAAAAVLAGLVVVLVWALFFYANLEPVPTVGLQTLTREDGSVITRYEERHGVFGVHGFVWGTTPTPRPGV